MKTSFVQIFDKKDDAVTALGFITGAYPNNRNSLSEASNQVQVWTSIAGASDAKTYGAPNAAVMYLVLSIATT